MHYGPGLEALSKVSFEITRGELVFLAGHSGAGKSTVMRLVLALETPSGGGEYVAGKCIKGCRNLIWHCIAGKLAPSFRIISCF